MAKYMTEYIDKEKAIYLVEKAVSKADAMNALRELSAADVVPVVRCKDCKHNSNLPEYGNAVCDCFYGMTDQMGFCHYGERREQA